MPEEDLFAPYNTKWLPFLPWHMQYWDDVENRKYAIEDTQHLSTILASLSDDEINKSHINSTLAWMIGTVRANGFAINIEKLKTEIGKIVIDIDPSPNAALRYLRGACNSLEQLAIKSTDKHTLAKLAKENDELGRRAEHIRTTRINIKRKELYDKLLSAQRLYPDFNVLGTKSNRMSGKSGLNVQGIQNFRDIRNIFTLADEKEHLSGGDFDAQEITIAQCVYNDPVMKEDILSGKKVHRFFASFLYEKDYDDVDAQEYFRGKVGVFALIYGANEDTLSRQTGVSIDVAKKAYNLLIDRYKAVGVGRKRIFDLFCSMTQPNGIGTEVVWKDPANECDSLFGFVRDFSLENYICKTLFDIAANLPIENKTLIIRRQKAQTVSGAIRSALYGACFRIQSKNMAAACNHEIQCPGATITKIVQYVIWELQQPGISAFTVKPINIHDEILVATIKRYAVAHKVEQVVKKISEKIPLVKITWKTELGSWADK